MSRAADGHGAATPGADGWSRRRRMGFSLGLILAVVAVYWNSLDAPFVFDDRPAIVDNPSIRHLAGSWRPPDNGSSAVGRPLVNVSFALNYAAGGLAVRGYHAVNVGLHACVALLLWGVLRRTLARTLPGGGEAIAAATALAWAVHPLLTESVTCVVQRNEVMTGGWYLLVFYGFLRSTDAGGRRWAWQLVAIGACWAGVFTKEVIATAPLLLWLFDRTFVSGSFRAAWARHRWFLLALAASWLPLAGLVLLGSQRTGTVGFGLGISAWDYLLTQCRALPLYLKLVFWPHPLVVDYGVPVVREWMEVAGRGLLLLGLLGATGWAVVRRPRIGFLGAWFFVILSPSSSVVPLTTQTIAEHRMYLPAAAVVLAATLAVRALMPRAAPAIVTALAVVLAGLTHARNETYRDEFRLWRQTIADQPENPRGYSNLANAYVRRGAWPEAVAQYRRAIALRPDFADAQNNLGLALLELKQTDEALQHLESAAELKPDDADIRYNLGNAYLQAAGVAPAIAQLRQALALRPAFPAAQTKLGWALLQAGRAAAAADAFAAAVRAQPDLVDALAGWGNALWQRHDGDGAIAKYRAALAIAPDVADLHYNLGNVFLGLGQLEEAAAEYRAALARDPHSPAAHHNLGLTLLRMGRPAEAIPHFEATLHALPNSAVAHANLSRALAQAGDAEKALAEALAARRLDPANPELLRWIAELQGAAR